MINLEESLDILNNIQGVQSVMGHLGACQRSWLCARKFENLATRIAGDDQLYGAGLGGSIFAPSAARISRSRPNSLSNVITETPAILLRISSRERRCGPLSSVRPATIMQRMPLSWMSPSGSRADGAHLPQTADRTCSTNAARSRNKGRCRARTADPARSAG